MRGYLTTLMLLAALAFALAAVRAPGGIDGLQREAARAYRVSQPDSMFARIDVDLAASGATLDLRCNGQARTRCPAAALHHALAWQPELTVWHDGSRIRQLRLNGEIVYAYERHGRWQRPLAFGLMLLCGAIGAALLALQWLIAKRRREWQEQDSEWHTTQIRGG